MAKHRMLLFSKKTRKKEIDIGLTALIDILTFILIFLLVSSGAGEFGTKLVSDLVMPQSDSANNAKRGITVQLNKFKDLYVEDKFVTSIKSQEWSDENRRIFNEKFKEKMDELDRIWRTNNNSEKFHMVVNLVVDKTLNYEHISQMMRICQYHGVIQYKFIATAN